MSGASVEQWRHPEMCYITLASYLPLEKQGDEGGEVVGSEGAGINHQSPFAVWRL